MRNSNGSENGRIVVRATTQHSAQTGAKQAWNFSFRTSNVGVWCWFVQVNHEFAFTQPRICSHSHISVFYIWCLMGARHMIEMRRIHPPYAVIKFALYLKIDFLFLQQRQITKLISVTIFLFMSLQRTARFYWRMLKLSSFPSSIAMSRFARSAASIERRSCRNRAGELLCPWQAKNNSHPQIGKLNCWRTTIGVAQQSKSRLLFTFRNEIMLCAKKKNEQWYEIHLSMYWKKKKSYRFKAIISTNE